MAGCLLAAIFTILTIGPRSRSTKYRCVNEGGHVVGIGTVELHVRLSPEIQYSQKMVLKNLFYVPTASCNSINHPLMDGGSLLGLEGRVAVQGADNCYNKSGT